MPLDSDAVIATAFDELYDETDRQGPVLAKVRDVVELMSKCQEEGISWAQVLVEADNCLEEYNLQRAPGLAEYEGDFARAGVGGIEGGASGWSWTATPQTVRWYMRGRLDLASLNDAALGKTLDFWFGRDESVVNAVEGVIEIAVDSLLNPDLNALGAVPTPDPVSSTD